MPAQPLDTPLWEFSLAVYSADGVADECLALQEHLGLDVNILLLAAYLGAAEGVSLTVADIATARAAVGDWHTHIVRPLRHTRQALKAATAEGSAALREQVKATELQAEKIEQGLLWQWSRQQLAGRPRGDRTGAITANLGAVLEFYRAPDPTEAALARLLVAAAAYRP